MIDLDLDSDSSSNELSGTLRIVNLANSPHFTALSYVWGDESSLSTLICNGCDVPDTKSCFEALSSLRRIYGGITIWVDAVCINQKDDEEKRSQIPLIGEIYSWAQLVYV